MCEYIKYDKEIQERSKFMSDMIESRKTFDFNTIILKYLPLISL